MMPKKSLGQNFLSDENILARIAATADLQPADRVLEIGPGVGTLTRHLAQTAVSVVAVELDDRLLPILQAELADLNNVRLIHGDILEQDPSRLFDGPYKVVANVPYYITGAILRHLLDGTHKPTMMVLTVQKEVAERITAVPPQMSLLAVSVQFYGQAEIAGIIKAGAFWPRPDVDSAIVRIDLTKRPFPNIQNERAFMRLVRAGFSQKRKQLRNNLQALGLNKKQLTAILDKAGIDARRRAETLSLAEWATLYETLWPALSAQ
ncbi:MAG: ribosomal RNA small subunit methyltransferase A [Chloroflexi bacterium]|nr:MAG: ribosomal RNA small subunit methyltransferase A [Chloroflexota bacterium]